MGLLFLQICVFFTEPVNTSGGIYEALLAGIKGMAVGAYFHVDGFSLGGQSFAFITAGAGNLGVVNFRMDLFFHDLSDLVIYAGIAVPELGREPVCKRRAIALFNIANRCLYSEEGILTRKK